MRKIFSAALLAATVWPGCGGDSGDDDTGQNDASGDADADTETDATAPSFAKDVLPILTARCATCHGASGGLSLASWADLLEGGSHGPAVVAKEPDNSLLVKRVEGTVQPQMPPNGAPLQSLQIQTIRDWIAAGAKND